MHLPSLLSLPQLDTLTASFNKLTAFTGLLPASDDAMSATAAAAAAAAVEPLLTPVTRGAESASTSRPGTAGSTGSRPSTVGSTLQHRGSSTEGPGQLLRCGSGASGVQQQHLSVPCVGASSRAAELRTQASKKGMDRRAQAVYDAAYEQHMQQLLQLARRNKGAVSSLPASLQQLQLSHNQLTVVPFELPAALPALTQLDLSYNRQVNQQYRFDLSMHMALMYDLLHTQPS